MPTATETKSEVQMIALGEIRFTTALNARPTNLDAVENYAVRWFNGERNIPPLILEPTTFEIVAGRHRFKMYEKVYSNWRDVKVPVIFDAKAPNPDKYPERFRAYSLNLNREHGVQITAADRNKALRDLVRAGEKEDRLKSWARSLGVAQTHLDTYLIDWKHEQEAREATETARQEAAATDENSSPAEIAERQDATEDVARAPATMRPGDAVSRDRMLGTYLKRVSETLEFKVHSLTDAEEKLAIVAVKTLIKRSDAVSRAIALLYR